MNWITGTTCSLYSKLILLKKLNIFLDLKYSLKFVFFLASFYYFNIFFLAIVTPGGSYYSSFLDSHFNYIRWITYSILYTTKAFVYASGSEALIKPPNIIRLASGTNVQVWLPCLGLGIMAFWVGFVLGHIVSWRIKVLWCLVGLVSIWLINCFRVTILLLTLESGWTIKRYMNHHDLFNVVAYLMILILAISFSKNVKSSSVV